MTTQRVRVALDLLGGDTAPDCVVDGALLVAAERPDVDVILVGPPDLAAAALEKRGAAERLQVVAATQSVEMGEDPVRAVRDKRDATVRVAARLVRDGLADATVTAGSTGAAIVAAVFTLGRLPGVTRPALAITVPAAGGPVVLLDAGANADCTPDLLAQFALAGAAYARAQLGIADPRVGLLCNGVEPGKGDQLRRQAHEVLSSLPMTFAGNVESAALTAGGGVDVVVADGFTGNVVLKGIEGMHGLARDLLLRRLDQPASALAVLEELAPERLGGAVLLGVPGVVVVGHGASTPRAVASCVTVAERAVREGLVPRVSDALAELVARRREAAGLPAVARQ